MAYLGQNPYGAGLQSLSDKLLQFLGVVQQQKQTAEEKKRYEEEKEFKKAQFEFQKQQDKEASARAERQLASNERGNKLAEANIVAQDVTPDTQDLTPDIMKYLAGTPYEARVKNLPTLGSNRMAPSSGPAAPGVTGAPSVTPGDMSTSAPSARSFLAATPAQERQRQADQRAQAIEDLQLKLGNKQLHDKSPSEIAAQEHGYRVEELTLREKLETERMLKLAGIDKKSNVVDDVRVYRTLFDCPRDTQDCDQFNAQTLPLKKMLYQIIQQKNPLLKLPSPDEVFDNKNVVDPTKIPPPDGSFAPGGKNFVGPQEQGLMDTFLSGPGPNMTSPGQPANAPAGNPLMDILLSGAGRMGSSLKSQVGTEVQRTMDSPLPGMTKEALARILSALKPSMSCRPGQHMDADMGRCVND